jgi:hypothetical protein
MLCISCVIFPFAWENWRGRIAYSHPNHPYPFKSYYHGWPLLCLKRDTKTPTLTSSAYSGFEEWDSYPVRSPFLSDVRGVEWFSLPSMVMNAACALIGICCAHITVITFWNGRLSLRDCFAITGIFGLGLMASLKNLVPPTCLPCVIAIVFGCYAIIFRYSNRDPSCSTTTRNTGHFRERKTGQSNF